MILILLYIVCSFLSYGLAFGYLQNKYSTQSYVDYKKDFYCALCVSIFGPLSLLTTLFNIEFGRYGFKII